ncbi:MAG: transcriptional repressor [Faecalibacterium sp.]
MRYSKQRELVRRKVEARCDHPTAEEIYDEAILECPGLSLGTVYRNLNGLCEAGRVRRVSIPGCPDRFDRTLAWHSHMYCTSCGSVTDVDVDEQGLLQLLRDQKGKIDSWEMVLFGTCESCCAQQAARREH